MYNKETHSSNHSDSTSEKILKCCFMDCDEKFIEKTDFVKHLSKHTSEKTFKCEFCTKTYLCPLTLRIHINKSHLDTKEKEINEEKDITTAERIFKCNYENCKQTFKGFKCLQNHIKKHLGLRLKSYLCHICNSRFISQVNLNAHVETHKEKFHKGIEVEKRYKTEANILSQLKQVQKKLSNNQVPLELLNSGLFSNSNTNNIPFSNILGYNQNLNIMYNGN
jgi:hypothetical protein